MPKILQHEEQPMNHPPYESDASAPPRSEDAILIWCAFAVLALAAVLPVFLTPIAPLHDYPNHLAQAHVLLNLERSEVLQRYYRNVMDWQPNLAMDAIVPLFARFIPIEVAGQIFVALTLLVTATGAVALHYAVHRRWSPWPLVVFFFLYHRMFLWGLVNYCFGLGVMLWALALWFAIRERDLFLRAGVSLVVGALVYLCHLYAFAIYILVLGSCELWNVFRRGVTQANVTNVLLAGLQAVLPLYLLLFHGRTSGVASALVWGSIARKLEAPFDTIYQYNLALDLGTAAFLAVLVGWGLLRREAVLARPLLPGLAALCAIYPFLPDQLFTGYGADRRLPIAIVLIGIASLDWPHLRRWWRQPVFAGLAILFLVRMGVVADVWYRAGPVYADYVKAIDMLPRGAKLVLYALNPEEQSLQEIPDNEIATLAVLRRDAFMPSLFTSPPLSSTSTAFTGEFEAIALRIPSHIRLPVDIRNLNNLNSIVESRMLGRDTIMNFDYVLLTHPEAIKRIEDIEPYMRIIYRGKDFALYKVAA